MALVSKKIEDQNIKFDTLDVKKPVYISVGINEIKKIEIFKSVLRGITAKIREPISNKKAYIKIWQK